MMSRVRIETSSRFPRAATVRAGGSCTHPMATVYHVTPFFFLKDGCTSLIAERRCRANTTSPTRSFSSLRRWQALDKGSLRKAEEILVSTVIVKEPAAPVAKKTKFDKPVHPESMLSPWFRSANTRHTGARCSHRRDQALASSRWRPTCHMRPTSSSTSRVLATSRTPAWSHGPGVPRCPGDGRCKQEPLQANREGHHGTILQEISRQGRDRAR
jgi:hypothetical protein